MKLNDFSRWFGKTGWLGKTGWFGKNTTAFIIVVAAAVVVSVMVGSLFGNAAKKRAQREKQGPALSVLELDESTYSPARSSQRGPGLILPESVVPLLTEGSSYSFYYDGDYYDIDEEELVPVTASDLLKSRDVGEDAGIGTFSFRGQEYEVLTVTDELSEP